LSSKHFLKPLIEEIPNLRVQRSKALRGDIMREIITKLVNSRVVVADLTDLNPNVLWELGIRQSFKHGTVTIADESQVLPFDIDKKGTLRYYPKNHLKNAEFVKNFKEAVLDCLKNPERPDSQVLETLSGRGTLFEIFCRDEAIRRLDAVLSECGSNISVIEDVVTTAKDNQETPSERSFPTTRFRTSAVDLLVTNRYIDEDRAFFDSAERYLGWLITLNDQLISWEYNDDTTEKWLLRFVKNLNVKKSFKDF